jgi:hypothetical protein
MWAGTGAWANDQGAAGVIVAMAFQSSSYRIGVIARASGSGATRSYYAFWAQLDTGGPNYATVLAKVINGVATVLHSGEAPWSDGDSIEIECSGTTISGFRNGTAVSGFSVTDATIASGVPGLYLRGDSTVPHMDSWTGFNVVAPVALASDASDSSAISGDVATGKPLFANAADASSASAALPTSSSPLAGDATDSSSATAAIRTGVTLSGSAVVASSVSAALTNWTSVTLSGTLYTGIGGILDPSLPWPLGAPGVGDTLFYDATNITILTNGMIVGTTNNCSAVVQFLKAGNDQVVVIVMTPGIVAYANSASLAAGTLSTAVQLRAAATALVVAAGALTTGIPLGSHASIITSGIGALTAKITFLGALIDSTSASADLKSSALAGNAADSDSATAAISTAIKLAAVSQDVVAAAGALVTRILVAAAAISTSSATGDLTIHPSGLAADAVSASAASAALVTQIRLALAATDILVASGTLSTQIPLIANAADTSSVAGAFINVQPIGGAAQVLESASSVLTTMIQMSGAAWASALAAGSLTTEVNVAGDAAASSQASGSLNAPGSPVGLYLFNPWFVVVHHRQRHTERFPVVAPSNAEVVTFDFAEDLLQGVRLEGRISIDVVASAGVDPNLPASLLAGPPVVRPDSDAGGAADPQRPAGLRLLLHGHGTNDGSEDGAHSVWATFGERLNQLFGIR